MVTAVYVLDWYWFYQNIHNNYSWAVIATELDPVWMLTHTYEFFPSLATVLFNPDYNIYSCKYLKTRVLFLMRE